MTVVLMTPHTGIRLAEVGFLLLVFAGAWLLAVQTPRWKLKAPRTNVAYAAIVLAGILLIIATHWGHFG